MERLGAAHPVEREENSVRPNDEKRNIISRPHPRESGGVSRQGEYPLSEREGSRRAAPRADATLRISALHANKPAINDARQLVLLEAGAAGARRPLRARLVGARPALELVRRHPVVQEARLRAVARRTAPAADEVARLGKVGSFETASADAPPDPMPVRPEAGPIVDGL